MDATHQKCISGKIINQVIFPSSENTAFCYATIEYMIGNAVINAFRLLKAFSSNGYY